MLLFLDGKKWREYEKSVADLYMLVILVQYIISLVYSMGFCVWLRTILYHGFANAYPYFAHAFASIPVYLCFFINLILLSY